MEKDLAARLREWIKQYGPPKVGDQAYGPTKTISCDMDPQAAVEFLLSAGLDKETVWPLLGITKNSLERGLKKLRRLDLLEQALSMPAAKVSERIEFRKE